jgi:hypothetical protein
MRVARFASNSVGQMVSYSSVCHRRGLRVYACLNEIPQQLDVYVAVSPNQVFETVHLEVRTR